ncbi:MAG: hypothetical protein V1670_03765 [Candidatus Omnitrophota bacterium]
MEKNNGTVSIFIVNNKIERDLGEQPIAKILAEHGFKSHDLVINSTQQVTHKMVVRAARGRRLNLKIQYRLLNALNKAAGKQYILKDLFNY